MRPRAAAAGAPAPGRIAAALEELTGLPEPATEGRLAEPIDGRATYRRKRYEKHLAPVMDKLAPHIGYFGYG